MRIFCAVRHSNDPGRYYGGLWSGNFYPALRALGHEVLESQVDLLPTSRFMSIADGFTPAELEVRARTTESIIEEVKKAQSAGGIDVFLSYFYNAHFDPAGFDELRQLGVPSINYYCNSIHQFPQVQAIAAKADFSWHAEKHAHQSYVDVGANPVWVQMAADPQIYRPVDGTPRAAKAVFVGQNYADRAKWMANLIQQQVPVDIYGPGWGEAVAATKACAPSVPANGNEVYLGRTVSQPGSWGSYMTLLNNYWQRDGLRGPAKIVRRWQLRRERARFVQCTAKHARGSIPFTKIAGVFSSYEVCLNFSNVWADARPGSALIPHVRLRDFEGPMSRACYLTGHTDEITEFYDVGREIDTYQTSEELADKTRYYLKNPDAAERLREAGWQRARRDHTWERRFVELFAKTGLK